MATAARITKGYESGYNPDSTKPSGECASKSDSEPVVIEGSKRALDVAARLGARWQERLKKEGKKVWVCPMSPLKERTHFPTKAKCQAYMNKEFAMRVEQAKLEKRPAAEWTPQPAVLAPVQTLADHVLPEHRARVIASQEAAQAIQKLGRVPSAVTSKYTAGVLVSMMESMAIEQVAGLSDDELKRCTHMAFFRSKKRLYRACKAQATNRGLVTTV